MKKLHLVFFTSLTLLGCGGSKITTNPSGSTTTLQTTIDGVSQDFVVSSATTTVSQVGTVTTTLTGKVSGGVAASLSFAIQGGSNIVIPADDPNTVANEAFVTIQVGSTTVNVTFETASTRYRATTGSLTFTKFDVTSNGTVEGSMDFGMVNPTGAGSGAIQGNFTSTTTN